MLHLVAEYHDPGAIPDIWLQRDFPPGFVQPAVAAHLPAGELHHRARVTNLGDVLVHPVIHRGAAAGADLPVEGDFEILEILRGRERGAAAACQRALDDLPVRRQLVLPVTAPVAERHPVKKETPALRALQRRELRNIRRGQLARQYQAGRANEDMPRFHAPSMSRSRMRSTLAPPPKAGLRNSAFARMNEGDMPRIPLEDNFKIGRAHV